MCVAVGERLASARGSGIPTDLNTFLVEHMFPLEEIEKIAALASLELSDAEKTTFAKQFEEILAYFKILDSAPAAPGPVSTPLRNGPLFREDVAVTSGVSPREFSPYLESGHFKVPKVIE